MDYRLMRIGGTRFQVDDLQTRFFGNTQNNLRISVGVVLRYQQLANTAESGFSEIRDHPLRSALRFFRHFSPDSPPGWKDDGDLLAADLHFHIPSIGSV